MIPSDDHPPQKYSDFKISCDDKVNASGSDTDLVADLDANPQSSFSIRDYVFNSRSKDIACNWPFSNKTLQICLQHEVKNILPPFQSLESIRNNSSYQETINSCNGKSNHELSLESKKSRDPQRSFQQGLVQTKSKKPLLGSSRKTEAETVMASKICPVCKIFSSSSNTTLNAHIDQCLSGESTMNWTANVPEVIIKHRIKPRKTRLMVDIYKSAPHCTVEELDARNGTSWANNSSFPDQEIEFHGHQEKEERASTTIVDSNRTKVRILSIPNVDNDASNDGSLKKGGKSCKVSPRKRINKNYERKHDGKYLKLNWNDKKSSSKVTFGPEEIAGSGESCNKEAMNKDDLPIVRPPWACSKRTGLAKKNLTVASDNSFSKSGFKLASSFNKTGILSQESSRKMGSLTPNKAHFAKKRSLLLTKPSSKHLKKCGTILHNTSDDPTDSFLVKGSDVMSKGSKNLLLVSRKKASKINLKRKFSALKTCQGSLKQKSVGKEDTSGKTSCESMNLSEVKKNEDPTCDVKSVKEQVSTIPRSSDNINMFDSRERVINVIGDTEKQQQQQHYHEMSDSPISTISNPSLARSDSDKFSVKSTTRNDEKHALVNLTSSGGWRSKGQSQTTSFKNDHQPCCCSKKEINWPQMFSITNFPISPPPPLPLPVKLPLPPSKPVIRLMGKNLTVVNTDEDEVHCSQFPNSLKNHALDTMFQSTTYGSPHMGPMLPAVNNNLGKWNCKPAGSSGSSTIYYPSSFS